MLGSAFGDKICLKIKYFSQKTKCCKAKNENENLVRFIVDNENELN
jgi:hypothetical protein